MRRGWQLLLVLGATGCWDNAYENAPNPGSNPLAPAACGLLNQSCCISDAGLPSCNAALGLTCDGFVCRQPTTTVPQPDPTTMACGRFPGDVCCTGNVCQGSLTCCGAVCADTLSDVNSCGGCGVACNGTCSGGMCSTVAPPTPTPTPAACGAASQACCVSGSACQTGLTCISGVCTGMTTSSGAGSPSTGTCGTLFGACCTSGAQCQGSNVCFLGLCVPNLNGSSSGGSTATGVGTACTSGSRSGTCIDTTRQSCSGTVVRNRCPGPTQVRCCLR